MRKIVFYAVCAALFCSCLSSVPADPVVTSSAKIGNAAQIAAFGLQITRSQYALPAYDLPVSVADVVNGPQKFSDLSPQDQTLVRHDSQVFAAAFKPYGSADAAAQSAVKTFALHNLLRDTLVTFNLYPFMELHGSAERQPVRNDIVGYGQAIKADSPDFARFLRSLTSAQKTLLFHTPPLSIDDLDNSQQKFIRKTWQSSASPECAQLCVMPKTQVTIGFFLAVIVKSQKNQNETYELLLPQSAEGMDYFKFDSAKRGTSWLEF